MVGFDGNSFIYNAAVTVEKTNAVYPLAQTQVHGSSENRPVLLKPISPVTWPIRKHCSKSRRHERIELLAEGKTDFVKDGTMYGF